jgi:hypothetical protein
MERKFKHYIIKVTNNENSFIFSNEIVNYKEALKTYNSFKEENKNNNCDIEFFGVFQNGEYKRLFNKSYYNELEPESEDVFDIMDKINTLVNKLDEREIHLKNLLSVQDKKREILLHFIENEEYATGTDKINTYDKLKAVSDDRRRIKEENILCKHYLIYCL